MKKSTKALLTFVLISFLFTACDKAPGGVIKEGDMAHVLADFAIAEAMMEQHPEMFASDSAKLALKQSILLKYDADLAKYDSSLVWYGHNLKIYTEVYDNAIKIVEKEGGIKKGKDGKPIMGNGMAPGDNIRNEAKKEFATTGDSANVWSEPQRWILSTAMQQGYITFDYKPGREYKKGDLYTLNFKLLYTNSTLKVMLAVDYSDGTSSYITRTAHVNGWSNYALQTDSTRNVKRIYGFINYNIKALGVAFLDSIYMLRTRLDASRYNMINVQRFVAPKAIREQEAQKKMEQQQQPGGPDSSLHLLPGRAEGLPGPSPQVPVDRQPAPLPRQREGYKPLPGLNKSSRPSRPPTPNPNGNHTPHAPIR